MGTQLSRQSCVVYSGPSFSMASGCQLLALLAIAFGDSAHAVRITAAVEEVAPTLGWECYCSLVRSEKECPDTGAAASAPTQPRLHRFFNPDDKSCCFLQYDKRGAYMMQGKPSTPPGPAYMKQLSFAKCNTDARSFPKRRCCRVLAGYDESSPWSDSTLAKPPRSPPSKTAPCGRSSPLSRRISYWEGRMKKVISSHGRRSSSSWVI